MMPAVAPPVHESELEHLLGMIDSIPSLIHTARPDGYLDYFNQFWLEYVGLPLEDLMGWKWTAVIHREDLEAIVNKWRSSLASGEPFLHEARVLIEASARSYTQRNFSEGDADDTISTTSTRVPSFDLAQ